MLPHLARLGADLPFIRLVHGAKPQPEPFQNKFQHQNEGNYEKDKNSSYFLFYDKLVAKKAAGETKKD